MLQKKHYATCIPLVSQNEETLWCEIDNAIQQNPDYLEWRRDYFLEDCFETEKKMLKGFKQKIGKTGLIYTFRDVNEGGFRNVAELERLKFITYWIEKGMANYIDIELDSSDAFLGQIQNLISDSSVRLLLSHHNFHKTYSAEKMMDIFKRMESKGADVLKLAMYAENEDDVKRQIEVAYTYGMKSEKPIIVISMGSLGTISRVFPDFIGGSLTYVAGKESTAPGQLTIKEISRLREKLGV
ncbi:MAG: type I 3-dehydroquinate dehydratase [Eubacterium sp.]